MRRLLVLPLIVVLLAPVGRLAAAEPAARLGIATPFVVLGSPAEFTLGGPPDAAYSVYVAAQPAEIAFGALGVLFLQPGTIVPAGAGRLSAAGTASLPVALPGGPALDGAVLYAQALVTAAGESRLTNAVPFRLQSAAAAGGRAPRSLAVTADGAKAYVAHQADGTVSVVDLIAGVKVADLPVGPAARGVPYRPLDVAIDPEGRHAFVVNAAAAALAVVDVASDSIAGQIPVPRGCRRIAFDFAGGARRIYVTNEIVNAVLVFDEATPGVFTALAPLPLQGAGPGPLAVLPDGTLAVGHRATLELELVDPGAGPGGGTLARIPLGTQPLDVAVAGGEALVPTFKPSTTPGMNGFNLLWRVDLAARQVSGWLFANAGTDYNDAAASGATVAVVGSGSGTLVIGDLATGDVLDRVDLVPGGGEPHGTPQAVALGPPAGAPARAYVVDQFRETLRAVDLAATPPFALGAEIALAHSGQPRVPLTGDLSAFESGEYLMRSGHFFNATAANPNSVTCQTCHTDGASDNVTRLSGRQPQALFNLANTAPYNWQGNSADLLALIRGAFAVHGEVGGPIADSADLRLLGFFQAFAPPASIHRLPGGAPSPQAQAGKALFDGTGQCTSCHAAPQFLPPAGQPLTIAAGVGTGLAPINVSSLRGVWATAPYFHDGSAKRLGDVFAAKPGDVHSTLTAGFSAEQIEALVAYLNSL